MSSRSKRNREATTGVTIINQQNHHSIPSSVDPLSSTAPPLRRQAALFPRSSPASRFTPRRQPHPPIRHSSPPPQPRLINPPRLPPRNPVVDDIRPLLTLASAAAVLICADEDAHGEERRGGLLSPPPLLPHRWPGATPQPWATKDEQRFSWRPRTSSPSTSPAIRRRNMTDSWPHLLLPACALPIENLVLLSIPLSIKTVY